MGELSTLRYLSPPEGYFWRWSADGAAVEWADGSTLAFTGEVRALLGYLEPGGLPPLGALLLLLAATRDWERRWPAILLLVKHAHPPGKSGGKMGDMLGRVRDGLAAVAALPEDLRAGLNAKALLADAVFEGIANRHPPETSARVLREWDEAAGKPLKSLSEDGLSLRLERDLKALASGLRRLDPRGLEFRLRAGLEAMPNPAAPPVPTDPPVLPGRDGLLRALEEGPEDELGAVGTLARRVVAMLAIPRPSGQPEDLPVGGVSDLGNRGDPERLLVSELAWDDWMFAARLAQGEAMYLRRECPPDAPATRRLILLDQGIRLWGIPRVLALACALGARAQAAEGEPVSVWARAGDAFHPCPLDTPADVRARLAALEPAPDPVPALEAFAEPGPEAGPRARPDLFLVSDEATLRDPSVPAALRSLSARLTPPAGRVFTAAVHRDGAVVWSEWSLAGVRVLVEARLDLDEVLTARKPAATPAAAPAATDTRPPEQLSFESVLRVAPPAGLAFFRRPRLPLAFPAKPLAPESLHPYANGWVGVDTGYRLVRWTGRDGRAEEILACLPPFLTQWLFPHPDLPEERVLIVLCGAGPEESVHLVDAALAGDDTRTVVAEAGHVFPSSAWIESGAVVLAYEYHAEALSLRDGRRLAAFRPNLGRAEFAKRGKCLRFDGHAFQEETRECVRPKPSRLHASDGEARFWRKFEPPVLQLGVLRAGIFDGSFLALETTEGQWWFDPSSCSWHRLDARRDDLRHPVVFADIEEDPSVLPMRRATWPGGGQLFHDSRGFLHVFGEGLPELSILLSTSLEAPAAAFVHEDGRDGWFGHPGWHVGQPGALGGMDLQMALGRHFAAIRAAAGGKA